MAELRVLELWGIWITSWDPAGIDVGYDLRVSVKIEISFVCEN